MKPKYKIGQRVWYMRNNEVKSSLISGIIFTSKKFNYAYMPIGTSLYYSSFVEEKYLWSSKEELLKSL